MQERRMCWREKGDQLRKLTTIPSLCIPSSINNIEKSHFLYDSIIKRIFFFFSFKLDDILRKSHDGFSNFP